MLQSYMQLKQDKIKKKGGDKKNYFLLYWDSQGMY